MAEHVQAALDQMVEPLKDLLDRQIFSSSEIHAIVERRRESEYLLRRRAARKADFLRYIQAEQNLEKLRVLRTAQRKRDSKRVNQEGAFDEDDDDDDNDGKNEKSSQKKESHIGDTHIVQWVHLLFVRAIRKFRSDLSLHLAHAEFCQQQKSYKRLGRVYAEALQIFPRQAGLWIEAASHEFFGPSKSIRNARILLQRGLRINSSAEELWLEYFSLELHYAQTLRGRRKILLEQKEEEIEGKEDDYTIAKVVFKNAIQSIPKSVPFRLQFLDTCRRFPSTHSLIEDIQASLAKDFDDQPEAWIARALYAAGKQANSDQTSKMEQLETEHNDEDCVGEEVNRPLKKVRHNEVDPVVEVLQQAVESIPTEEMVLQAFRFAKSYQSQLESIGQKNGAAQVSSFIESLLRTHGSERSSSELILEQVDYWVDTRKSKVALQNLEEFCTTSKSSSAAVWIKWASLVNGKEKAASILRKALDRIPFNDHDHIRILLCLFGVLMSSQSKDEKQISEIFQRILVLAPGIPNLELDSKVLELPFGIASIPVAHLKYLEYQFETKGLIGARKAYSAVLFQSSPRLDDLAALKAFVDKCIQLEQKDKKRLRRVYDRAIELFEGTSLEDIYRDERNENAI